MSVATEPTNLNRPFIELRGLSKSFAGNVALSDCQLSLRPGEIHILVGANGSGKSTLIKILSGFHEPEPGASAVIDGEALTFGSADHAYRLGCRFVHQDLGLVSALTVNENLHLSGYPCRFYTVRAREALTDATEMLAAVGLELDPERLVSELGAAERTGVALARAMRHDPTHPPKLLVLDEPTASLPPDEVDHLLDMVRRTAARGVAILFVTHHIDEVFSIGDTVTVLRDGAISGRFDVADTTRKALIRLIAGGEIIEPGHRPERPATIDSKPPLVVESLHAGAVRGVSLTASRGEVLGIAGLTGSGRETILGAIFGGDEAASGEVIVNQMACRTGGIRSALAAGMGFLPADRKAHGGVMTLSARENLSLANLRPFWRRWRLQRAEERIESDRWFRELNIHPAGAGERELITFSGGNQQKILFAKWMRRRPVVFLLDEPSQGVDVGAKAEIHRHLLEAATEGMTILVASTDLEELEALATRVLVMRRGRIAHELMGPDINVATITRCVLSDRDEAGER